MKLDVVKAALTGFGVVGRNPLAVLVWALLLFVIGVAPVLGLFSGFITSIIELAKLETTGAEPTPEQILPFIGTILLAIPVVMFTGLILRSLLTAAIFRAVLSPEEKRWFYLRVGSRELWLALLIVVVGVLLFLVNMGISLITFPLALAAGFSAAATMDESAIDALGLLIQIPVTLLTWGVMGFLAARFGMCFPMTFAENQFRLFESWSFTRGNGWRVFLMVVLLMAFGLVIWAVLLAVGVAALVGVIGVGAMTEGRLEAFFAQEPAVLVRTLTPWFLGVGAIACLAGAVLTTIFIAPWADAYRQILTAKPAAPAVDPAPAPAA